MTRRTLILTTITLALLVPAVALASGAEGAFNGSRFFRHILNLALFVGFMVYVARTPLADFLQFRRTEIKEGLDKAFDAKANAQNRHTEVEARLEGLDDELAEGMSRVASDGTRERERLVEAGHEAARQIAAATLRAVDEETRRAASDLREEAIELAMAQAGELLVRSVGAADQKRLADSYLTTLQESAQS